MIIIGCDYHPGFQQIAFVDTETGECGERRLEHREEAEKFYRDLGAQGAAVRLGMEASGHARWFERLLGELRFELWIFILNTLYQTMPQPPFTEEEIEKASNNVYGFVWQKSSSHAPTWV